MIELYMGKPGSGKSYYAITQIVEAVKSGRRVWCLMDVAMSDYWVEMTGVNYEDVQSRLKIVGDMSFMSDVGSGDLVVIDECQRFMRAGSEPDMSLLFVLETHRHMGIDIILITQDYMKILRQVYILAENVFRFRKMAFLGVNKARVRVCTGVRADDEVRAYWMSYNPKYFKLYKSYFKDAVSEKTNKKTIIWRSPIVIVAVAMIIVIVYVMGFRSWFNAGAEEIKPGISSRSVDTQTVGKSDVKNPVQGVGGSPAGVIEIEGTACSGDLCFVLLRGGRMMTVEALISEAGSGVGVILKRDGMQYVQIEGVRYVGVGYNSN